MAAGRTLWLLLPRQLREVPADLAAASVFVLIANAVVFLPVVSETPLRVVLGFVFVLFVPGYTFVAAVFPESASTQPDESHSTSRPVSSSDIGGIERIALSFGLSIALVPLIGLIIDFSPWGIRLEPIMVALSIVTLASVGVGTVRRRSVPVDERLHVPFREWWAALRSELLEPDSQTTAVLNVVMALSVLLALGSIGYVMYFPNEENPTTELYLLTENDGELVVDGYPTNFTVGESKPIVVGVGNHEYQPREYTIVVQLQRVNVTTNSTEVTEVQELDLFQTSVPDNETRHIDHEVAPTMTGDNLRLAYLLYIDDPPSDPTLSNAYREVHYWITVEQNDS